MKVDARGDGAKSEKPIRTGRVDLQLTGSSFNGLMLFRQICLHKPVWHVLSPSDMAACYLTHCLWTWPTGRLTTRLDWLVSSSLPVALDAGLNHRKSNSSTNSSAPIVSLTFRPRLDFCRPHLHLQTWRLPTRRWSQSVPREARRALTLWMKSNGERGAGFTRLPPSVLFFQQITFFLSLHSS